MHCSHLKSGSRGRCVCTLHRWLLLQHRGQRCCPMLMVMETTPLLVVLLLPPSQTSKHGICAGCFVPVGHRYTPRISGHHSWTSSIMRIWTVRHMCIWHIGLPSLHHWGRIVPRISRVCRCVLHVIFYGGCTAHAYGSLGVCAL